MRRNTRQNPPRTAPPDTRRTPDRHRHRSSGSPAAAPRPPCSLGPPRPRRPALPPSRPPLPPPVAHPPGTPLRPGFRPSAPLPPTPRGEPTGYGPSCFFPARTVGVLLAPAVAAVLTVLSPAPANASASPALTARAEHGAGPEHGAGRTPARPAGAVRTEGAVRAEGGAPGQATARRVIRGHAGTAPRAAARSGGPARPRGAARHRGAARQEVAARDDPRAADRAWPVGGTAGVGPTVVRGWEPPPSPWAAGHRGVDLAASAGAPVRAAAPGRVAYAGTVAGRGVLTIEVALSGRPPLRTTYEPVQPTVHKGQRVTAGQPVAVLQHGPFHCRAPCLHWGLRRGKNYLDPLSLLPRRMLRGGPSRLLPIFEVPVPAGDRTVPGQSGPAGPQKPAIPAKPAAQEGSAAPTGAALMTAAVLAAAAVWALGRLNRARPGGTEKDV
ncbi:murein hydrolase activator EnvC family protein [Streptomyces caniferus]|uniref:murein hydrolase activator EnvC family protein n=1 Tax=Streptomyces caniferus TaxID=285557 RepID=UPI002E2BBCC8|nr:peptidoglycan DD-metalloendopeptidase family protein [Streptomyces caniferus]